MITLIEKTRLETNDPGEARLIGYVAKLVSAYVKGNSLPAAELPDLVGLVHRSISGLSRHGLTVAASRKPSDAEIRKSIQPDCIVSFLDGKPYKTLKRHLTSNDLTPAQYRDRFGLPNDYPMVASEYAAVRARIARSIRLGLRAA